MVCGLPLTDELSGRWAHRFAYRRCHANAGMTSPLLFSERLEAYWTLIASDSGWVSGHWPHKNNRPNIGRDQLTGQSRMKRRTANQLDPALRGA